MLLCTCVLIISSLYRYQFYLYCFLHHTDSTHSTFFKSYMFNVFVCSCSQSYNCLCIAFLHGDRRKMCSLFYSISLLFNFLGTQVPYDFFKNIIIIQYLYQFMLVFYYFTRCLFCLNFIYFSFRIILSFPKDVH